MTDLRALHGQQVKWTYGSIDLLWPGQRGDTKGQPMHPNLRLRWFENVSMVFNIATRMAFLLLLFAALSIHAFVFNPVWLIPPAVAVGLNLRMAMAMHDKSKSDIGYAVGVIPAEAYMWIRMGHFMMTSWAQFFSRVEKDNWAAQASAEKGEGKAYIFPAIVAATTFGILIFAWGQQSVGVQSAILSLGWPMLYLITITSDPVHDQEVHPQAARLHRLTWNLQPRHRSSAEGQELTFPPRALSVRLPGGGPAPGPARVLNE